MISHSEGQEMVFKLQRGEGEIEVKGKPEQNKNGEYKMGIWVRDNAQGVGTMTYIDEQGNFGALGHGINDMDTSTLMSLEKGTLYHTEIIGITRGSIGSPGELTGFIEYDDNNIMGEIRANTLRGIFGVCTQETQQQAVCDYMQLGLKQEIKKDLPRSFVLWGIPYKAMILKLPILIWKMIILTEGSFSRSQIQSCLPLPAGSYRE